ncbi:MULTISPECIES: hypothetical protein [unclassified Oceanispirochaeta]|uniref:hypothetical protein n=1 Tax=unclassified Oceanispirochaeta TaxID=2635722 RepID=UPI000E09CB23|nr:MULTISPECIES: hypothetical protein [unclassified Oceanispirochaeta]MBF9017053.1 hypothetical protein [Oceanispirochaeta sp. M2]NPD73502.1 hypothetical protein [Oceanispirochaeta sp. M1]RDG30793.1 hypothetical protein DV872_15505 [Oceanispirochaeta sp. M1]
MKKALLIFLSVLFVFSFMACDDSPMEVSIEDWNADQQFNYALEGKTFATSEPFVIVKTNTNTATSDSVTRTSLVDQNVSAIYSELTDNAGTFSMSYSLTFTSAFDVAYVDTATIGYSIARINAHESGGNDWFDDEAWEYVIGDFATASVGFAGKTLRSVSVSGTYKKIEKQNGVNYYDIIITSYNENTPDNNVADGTTKSGTYPATVTGSTYTEAVNDWTMKVSPGDKYSLITSADGVDYLEMEFSDIGFKDEWRTYDVMYTAP